MNNLNKISSIICLVLLLGSIGCNKTTETTETTDSTMTTETDTTKPAAESYKNEQGADEPKTMTADPEGEKKCNTTDPANYELCARYDNILIGGSDAGYNVYFRAALPFMYKFEASDPRFDIVDGIPSRIITLTATKTAENAGSIESADSKKISIAEIKDHPAKQLIVELITDTDNTTTGNEPDTASEKKGPSAIVAKKVILVRTNGASKKLAM